MRSQRKENGLIILIQMKEGKDFRRVLIHKYLDNCILAINS
jgi:hypothetical protein